MRKICFGFVSFPTIITRGHTSAYFMTCSTKMKLKFFFFNVCVSMCACAHSLALSGGVARHQHQSGAVDGSGQSQGSGGGGNSTAFERLQSLYRARTEGNHFAAVQCRRARREALGLLQQTALRPAGYPVQNPHRLPGESRDVSRKLSVSVKLNFLDGITNL